MSYIKTQWVDNVTMVTASGMNNIENGLADHGEQLDANLIQLGLKANKLQQTKITPTLLNTWVNFGGTQQVASYFKDEFSIVHLSGLIKGGVATVHTALFVLPTNYRPLSNTIVICVSNNGATDAVFHLSIDTAGNVMIDTVQPFNVWLNLDGITFNTQQ